MVQEEADSQELENISSALGQQNAMLEKKPADCLTSTTKTRHQELNIWILDNLQILSVCAVYENESISVHKNYKNDWPVEKRGLRVLIRFIEIMRHLWSPIQHLHKGCCVCLCFLFLLASMVGFCDARAIRTNQNLPPECYKWFDVYECPIKAEWQPPLWDNKWGTLNEICCAGFPGTILHCQRNGASHFPACLPDQPVGKGFAGKLFKDDEGNPQFKQVPCDSLTYEPDERVSSNVTFPYCLSHKDACNGEGEVLACHGGSVANDKCTCLQGYRPSDGCNFKEPYHCFCQPLNCPEGEVPVRTPPIKADICSVTESQTPPQFYCDKEPANTGISTSGPSQGATEESDTSQLRNEAQPKTTTTDSTSDLHRYASPKDNIGTGLHLLYAFIAFFSVVLLLCIVVALVNVCKKKLPSLVSNGDFSFSRLADDHDQSYLP